MYSGKPNAQDYCTLHFRKTFAVDCFGFPWNNPCMAVSIADNLAGIFLDVNNNAMFKGKNYS